jgi:hypothetical protein
LFLNRASHKLLQLELVPITRDQTDLELPSSSLSSSLLNQRTNRFAVRVHNSQESVIPTTLELFDYILNPDSHVPLPVESTDSSSPFPNHGDDDLSHTLLLPSPRYPLRRTMEESSLSVESSDIATCQLESRSLKRKRGRPPKRKREDTSNDDDNYTDATDYGMVDDWNDASDAKLFPFANETDGISAEATMKAPDASISDGTNASNADVYAAIGTLHHDCLQLADEKVIVAKQVYDLIDGTVQSLDKDLVELERVLRTAGTFVTDTISFNSSGYVPSATAASAALTPAGEVVGSNATFPTSISSLSTAGDSAEVLSGLVACQVETGSEWILAKILHFDPVTRMFQLIDEDAEVENKGKLIMMLNGCFHTTCIPSLF